jgi:succinate dehydrogenase / fumarate reductase, iron-sulfur subunit
MEVTLKIRRSPDGASHHVETYTVDVPETATLLDALDAVKDKRDGTLAYRKSCRMAVCGSCGMRMDGGAVLACKTAMKPLVERGHVPTISPMGNLPVIKDLVVDMEPFWAKIRAVKPFLQTEEHPDKEHLVEMPVQTANIGKEALCIMCGCCVSECNSMESDPDFLGPAALAKAQRFVGDQREGDDDRRARLKDLNGAHGIWDCTRCYFCNQRCPKGVDPRDAIAKLGAETFRHGSGSEFGAKTNMFAPIGTVVEPGVAHAQVFVDSTRRGGYLDETQLVPKTIGPVAALLDVPFALQLVRAGKVPNPLHKHKAKNNDEVKRLWKLLQQQARGHEGLPTNHPSLIDSHD